MFHQLFILGSYKIGQLFFSNTNDIVAFINFSQMIILDLIFSYTIYFLHKRNIKVLFIGIIIAYFALYPSFPYHSFTIWKDVLFGGFVLLFLLNLINLIEKKDNINFKDLISGIISTLLMLLFRNNAIYMYILLIPFLLILFQKQLKKVLMLILVSLLIFFTIKGPIYQAFGIKKSSSAEYLAIPLQQIGRMAYKDVEFTQEEQIVLNKLLPLEIMKKAYNPSIVDNIKFHEQYDGGYFDNNRLLFFKTYIGLVLKHPTIAIESYLISTLGYWYPDVIASRYWFIFSTK